MNAVTIDALKNIGQIYPVQKVAENLSVSVNTILELAAVGTANFTLYIDLPKDYDVYMADIRPRNVDQKRRFEKISNIEFLALSPRNCRELLEPIYGGDRASEATFSQALIQCSDQTYATTDQIFSFEKALTRSSTLIPAIPIVRKIEYQFVLYTFSDMSGSARYPAPRAIPDGIASGFGRENLYITDWDIQKLVTAIKLYQQEMNNECQVTDDHVSDLSQAHSEFQDRTQQKIVSHNVPPDSGMMDHSLNNNRYTHYKHLNFLLETKDKNISLRLKKMMQAILIFWEPVQSPNAIPHIEDIIDYLKNPEIICFPENLVGFAEKIIRPAYTHDAIDSQTKKILFDSKRLSVRMEKLLQIAEENWFNIDLQDRKNFRHSTTIARLLLTEKDNARSEIFTDENMASAAAGFIRPEQAPKAIKRIGHHRDN